MAGKVVGMQGVLSEVSRWLADGKPVALARVVEVVGSGVRPAGAAMAVTKDAVIGSASGGCVEGALVEEARRALSDNGEPRLRTFGCTDDEAFDVGLTCGGLVRVLIERLDPGACLEKPWFTQLVSAVEEGKGVALVEVIDGPDVLLGWKGVVCDQLPLRPEPAQVVRFAATGDEVPSAVARDALSDLAAERSGVHSYDVRYDDRDTEVTVFVDSFPSPANMVIIGAASFTAALAAQARLLGYRVAVCDARPMFASPARFPQAHEVVAEWPDRYLERVSSQLGSRDAVCVLTHDPKFDVPAILAALKTEAGYIGVMGSRRTQEDRRKRLREAGAKEVQLERLRGPIGLDLGANSSEETAVSIVAEIIALRRGGSGLSLTTMSGPIHARTVAFEIDGCLTAIEPVRPLGGSIRTAGKTADAGQLCCRA
jgi:xanthine dehydrogenase accessory factor